MKNCRSAFALSPPETSEHVFSPTRLILSSFQEMIDEADRDGDGEVSEQEFLRIMKKTNLY